MMPNIPRNNLKDRMIKLGYDPKSVTIKAPVLDNSRVVKQPMKIEPQQLYQESPNQESFVAPKINNIDEWSDFEDD